MSDVMVDAGGEDRLAALLAGRDLDELSMDELEELSGLAGSSQQPELLGELLVAMDRAAGGEEMPAGVRESLAMRGRMLHIRLPGDISKRRLGAGMWLAAAATLAIVGSSVGYAFLSSQRFEREERVMRERIATLQGRIEANQVVLAEARSSVDSLRFELESRDGLLEEQRLALAAAAEKELEYATSLARVTMDLELAELEIARFETPVDPETLAVNRQRLMEVPATIRVEWQPFDLAEAPAEQRGTVRGDVVWNDQLEQGYLRFVGLEPNDPNVEQYQVWVIDERGLEQKVSGGVFNATARGEVIVPIDPGIEIGRVALFAVTVEAPGGTWVPSLDRRVVVAPREEG